MGAPGKMKICKECEFKDCKRCIWPHIEVIKNPQEDKEKAAIKEGKQ
jgi:hypothetical protein